MGYRTLILLFFLLIYRPDGTKEYPVGMSYR